MDVGNELRAALNRVRLTACKTPAVDYSWINHYQMPPILSHSKILHQPIPVDYQEARILHPLPSLPSGSRGLIPTAATAGT